jgi:hypothetical protein
MKTIRHLAGNTAVEAAAADLATFYDVTVAQTVIVRNICGKKTRD